MKVTRKVEIETDEYVVGDVIDFTLNDGEEVQALAVKKTNEGMLFVLVDCLKDEEVMNEQFTNKGGYEYSDLRKKLNDEIISRFPEVIKSKLIPFANGDLLRLPTEKEIFGVNKYGERESDEVEQWEPMKDRRNRIAFESKDSQNLQWHWLSNKAVVSSTSFAHCYNNGFAYSYYAYGTFGVRPAFLIG